MFAVLSCKQPRLLQLTTEGTNFICSREGVALYVVSPTSRASIICGRETLTMKVNVRR
jgi:hypothetical protein